MKQKRFTKKKNATFLCWIGDTSEPVDTNQAWTFDSDKNSFQQKRDYQLISLNSLNSSISSSLESNKEEKESKKRGYSKIGKEEEDLFDDFDFKEEFDTDPTSKTQNATDMLLLGNKAVLMDQFEYIM